MSQITRLNSTFFTGSQAEILFNGVKIEQIVGITGQYTMDHIPMFSYKSTHFNAVAPGKGMANGSFAINYVSSGYLLSVINKMSKSVEINADGITTIQKPKPIYSLSSSDEYYQDIVSTQDSLNEELFPNNKIKEDLREKHWGANPDTKDVRVMRHPEMFGPIDILIRDFRIGTMDKSSPDAYEERLIKNCFISTVSTSRTSTPNPTNETYQFIGQIFI